MRWAQPFLGAQHPPSDAAYDPPPGASPYDWLANQNASGHVTCPTRESISPRTIVKSIGLVRKASAPLASALRLGEAAYPVDSGSSIYSGYAGLMG